VCLSVCGDGVGGLWRGEGGGFGRGGMWTRWAEMRMESGLTDGNRIQTWALEEARRRLEAEGILKEPSDKQ